MTANPPPVKVDPAEGRSVRSRPATIAATLADFLGSAERFPTEWSTWDPDAAIDLPAGDESDAALELP